VRPSPGGYWPHAAGATHGAAATEARALADEAAGPYTRFLVTLMGPINSYPCDLNEACHSFARIRNGARPLVSLLPCRGLPTRSFVTST
jgi:hypothetical protein